MLVFNNATNAGLFLWTVAATSKSITTELLMRASMIDIHWGTRINRYLEILFEKMLIVEAYTLKYTCIHVKVNITNWPLSPGLPWR